MPNQVIAPGVRKNVAGFGLDFSAVADVLTYTPPTNKRGEVTATRSQGTAATSQLRADQIIGANRIFWVNPAAGAEINQLLISIMLNPGESFVIRVIAGTALDVGDAIISIMEEA